MKHELHTPTNLSPLARACLERLADHGELVSIGGAVGLACYPEYCTTADVHAWWEGGDSEQRAKLLGAVEDELRRFGDVERRSWGDVQSVEVRSSDGSNFSFQVARRSARLREPVAAPWPTGLRVDSLVVVPGRLRDPHGPRNPRQERRMDGNCITMGRERRCSTTWVHERSSESSCSSSG